MLDVKSHSSKLCQHGIYTQVWDNKVIVRASNSRSRSCRFNFWLFRSHVMILSKLFIHANMFLSLISGIWYQPGQYTLQLEGNSYRRQN